MTFHRDAPTERFTRIGAPASVPPRRRRTRTSTVAALVLLSALSGAGLRIFHEWSATRSDGGSTGEVRSRCWDGQVVGEDGRCDVAKVGAQFWAFGLEEDDCRADPHFGNEHNTTSYECLVEGVAVHVAAYQSFDARARRLARYGPTADLGGARVFAGGPDQHSRRYIRTYDASAARQGLLMYASVAATPEAEDVLTGLRQRTADALLGGVPITTSE